MSVQWHVGQPEYRFIYGPKGEHIATVDSVFREKPEAKELAAFIVRACNAYYGLLADADRLRAEARVAHEIATAQITAATAQRDALAAALRMVCDSGVTLAEPIERAMLAALAKAGAL